MLELFLFRTFPRGDVKPRAKALLTRFGDMAGVLGASLDELQSVPGIGEAAALDLKLMQEGALRQMRAGLRKRTVISSWTALLGYVRVMLASEAREQFRVLFLDKKNQLIADEQLGQGTVDHAPVYPREVIKRALELKATALILVHNHPSGDPTPSRDDLEMTQEVKRAATALSITLHDHVIIGNGKWLSFRQEGLL